MLGQGIATLFGKPADREDAGPVSQRIIFSELEFRLLKGEELKSWFQSDSEGDVLISSFLQPFTCGPGKGVSCELNKGILAEHSGMGGRVLGDGPLCIL